MQAYGEAKKLNTLTTSFAKLPRIGTIKYAEALLCSAQILSHMAQQTTVPSFNLKLGQRYRLSIINTWKRMHWNHKDIDFYLELHGSWANELMLTIFLFKQSDRMQFV